MWVKKQDILHSINSWEFLSSFITKRGIGLLLLDSKQMLLLRGDRFASCGTAGHWGPFTAAYKTHVLSSPCFKITNIVLESVPVTPLKCRFSDFLVLHGPHFLCLIFPKVVCCLLLRASKMFTRDWWRLLGRDVVRSISSSVTWLVALCRWPDFQGVLHSSCTGRFSQTHPGLARWSGPNSKAVSDVFWLSNWSLHLVEVPASHFPLELALGCHILGTNTLALWFSFLCFRNFILCNQLTRCWVGKTRWWQRTELWSFLLYLAAWWEACGKEGRLERSGGEARRSSLSCQTSCQEVNAMRRMDWRGCGAHDCNTQEPPPDGGGDFLALGTLPCDGL